MGFFLYKAGMSLFNFIQYYRALEVWILYNNGSWHAALDVSEMLTFDN
jgi:hypothetical protein